MKHTLDQLLKAEQDARSAHDVAAARLHAARAATAGLTPQHGARYLAAIREKAAASTAAEAAWGAFMVAEAALEVARAAEPVAA